MSELGRHNYVTPTSYLELIAAFRQLLTQKRDTVMKAKKRYTNGLDKLAFAESQVGRIPNDLENPKCVSLYCLVGFSMKFCRWGRCRWNSSSYSQS